MSDRAVAFIVDPNYRMQLATALWSLAQTNAADLDAVAILSTGLSRTDRDRIERPIRNLVSAEWFDLDDSTMQSVQLSGSYTVATCYKLILGEILPRHWDRVLYLDADVLVLGSVAPLFDLDLEESIVGAVRDPRLPWLATARVPWREMSLEPGTPNFNAGVQVVPLSVWRERDVAGKGLEMLRRHRVPLLDQGVLNILAEGAWTRLPPRFNAQNGHFFNRDASMVWAVEPVSDVEEAVRSPTIVHFNAGERRPWEPGSVHPFAPHWIDALGHTDWAGWRPPVTPRMRRALTGARRRTVRTVRALRAG